MLTGGSSKLFLHGDLLGSVRWMSTGNAIRTEFVYDAWGNVVSTSGGDDCRYQYGGKQGYYTDPGTGLLKLGARYYDPTIGRFITKDPAQDGVNWYAYCQDNPVGAVDPTGLTTFDLSDVQKPFVENAIGLVRNYNSYIGSALTDWYEHNRIVYNDTQCNGYYSRLWNQIQLGQSYQDDFLSVAAEGHFYYELRIGTTLVHEYTHSQQSSWLMVTNNRKAEIGAYQAGLDFIGGVWNKYLSDYPTVGPFSAIGNVFDTIRDVEKNYWDMAKENVPARFLKRPRLKMPGGLL